ncbi:ABC transporter substrate-binding protein [Nitriliruptoraceae bacterium ZYF776]|nr:ABC transporter substrate-binding protein [Profundirhabdus halotolerans]
MNRSKTSKRLAMMAVLAMTLAACGNGDGGGDPGAANGDDGADPGGEVTTYNIAWLSDFSGPYADVWPAVNAGQEAVLDWWNDEVGSELGVRVEGRTYDHRYDPSQVASLWPGILSDLDPIAALGVGGPDVAALQERLPDDQVPMLMSTAGYGYAWTADPWVFNPRATYGHEAAAFLQWYAEENGIDDLRFGNISSEASPAYVDIVEGTESWAEVTDGFTYVGTEYADVQPADLTTEVRRLLSQDVDVILTQTNTTAAVLTVQALAQQGADDVVTMVSAHNGLVASGDAAGDLCVFDGMYEAYGMAIPAEESGEAFEFYSLMASDYGLQAEWDVPTVQGLMQQIYAMRVIEDAVAAVGAENLDGAAVREAALNAEITQDESFSLLSELQFTPDAPFPTEGLTVNVGTVSDCTYSLAAADASVPVLEQWGQ